MRQALSQPMPIWKTAALLAVTLLGTALYCRAYTQLGGAEESLSHSLAWAVINVAPWVIAFEAGKRTADVRLRVAAALSGLGLSLFLQIWIDGSAAPLAFEFTRRLPGLLITLTLLALPAPREADRASLSSGGSSVAEFRWVDWISAAGNYVELHGGGRTVVERASLSRLEKELEGEGFVRIHRSLLVRRERIARVRPRDVILHDGTPLRTGTRYRALLEQEIRPFVPRA